MLEPAAGLSANRWRDPAVFGTACLLIHIACTVAGMWGTVSGRDPSLIRAVSSVFYMAGYVCFSWHFRRFFPILSLLFAGLLVVGTSAVMMSLLIRYFDWSIAVPVWLGEFLPIAMMFFAVILWRSREYLRVIAGLYAAGSVLWWVSLALPANAVTAVYGFFAAELLGMFGTIWLIAWTIVWACGDKFSRD